MKKAEEEEEEEEEVLVGETFYRSRAYSIKDEQGAYLYSVHILEDITESRRAEAVLHESEEKFRMISESAQDAIIMMADKRISFWNAAAERIFGYTAAEALGQALHGLIVPPPARAGFTQAFPHFQQSGEGPIIGKVIEVTALRKGGEEFPVELSVSAAQFGGQWHAIGIVRDITQRKQAEKALKESEENYRSIYENTQVGLYRTRVSDGKLMMANDAMARMFGFDSIAEATAKYVPSQHYVDPGTRERLLDAIQKYGRFDNFEACLTRSDGIARWFQYSGRLVQNKNYIEGVATDITERKQMETELGHTNRALAALGLVNRNLVRVESDTELFQATCDAIVQQRGYRLAWVGYVLHDESKSIKVIARAGHDEGYLDNIQLTWSETERGKGLSGQAIRSGVVEVCQDMINDPNYHLWRDEASKRGYASDIALPLFGESGSVFGILHVYSDEMNAFTSTEITLLKEMAGDMVFGLHSLHIRRERDLALVKNQEQLVQLQGSLEDTVRAIASIAEMRDPYTAGHQVRVADLAAAIARQMGLSEEQVHAIHLAGVVHDLGKIQVPAEILSKPGKIDEMEFSLIKRHPQAGYDILKGINFPWPIAQMVLQHHERLDGSGYPQGLKGEAILLEARILGVADVVEAMSSHRPYRPGLGVETALAEIAKQRGSHFDPQVVDACLTLFREQHYSFKS